MWGILICQMRGVHTIFTFALEGGVYLHKIIELYGA